MRRCCGCCCGPVFVTLAALSLVLFLACTPSVMRSSFALHHPACTRPRLVLMRFFRDVSRHKARRRLNDGADTALTTIVLGREEPLRVRDHAENSEDGTDFTMSPQELADMDGKDGRPLYLSIRGRIYDVTSGRSFYGPGRSYHHFIGRDASRAFATGCSQPACLVPHLDGLSRDDLREVDRWVELYEFHDKYSYVGRLVSEDPVGDAVDAALREEEALRDIQKEVEASSQDRDPKPNPDIFVDALVRKGKERYLAGSMPEAVMFWSAALTRMGDLTEDGVGGEAEEVDVDAHINVEEGAEENARQRTMDLNFWADGMLRRANILSFLAAASQKRASKKSLDEALARYMEAAATVARVIKFVRSSHSNNAANEWALTPCSSARAWMMQARIEGDLAAIRVMRGAIFYRANSLEGRYEGAVEFLGMHKKALASFTSAQVFIKACTETMEEADPRRSDLLKRWKILQSSVENNYQRVQEARGPILSD